MHAQCFKSLITPEKFQDNLNCNSIVGSRKLICWTGNISFRDHKLERARWRCMLVDVFLLIEKRSFLIISVVSAFAINTLYHIIPYSITTWYLICKYNSTHVKERVSYSSHVIFHRNSASSRYQRPVWLIMSLLCHLSWNLEDKRILLKRNKYYTIISLKYAIFKKTNYWTQWNMLIFTSHNTCHTIIK